MDIEELIEELQKSSNDDSKKFALLLIISQLIKTNKLEINEKSKEINERLFHSIGPHFLARLLTSEQVPDNCPKLIYKSIALSILVQFNEYQHLATDPIIITKIKQILQTFETCIDAIATTTDDSHELEVNLIDNIFKYFFALSGYCGNHLCKNGLLDSLLRKIFLNETASSSHVDISIQLVERLCQFDETHNYECKEQIQTFVKAFINEIDVKQNEFKFNFIKSFVNLLHTVNDVYLTGATFLSDIDKNLFNILTNTINSRVKIDFKKHSFELLDFYVKNFDLSSVYKNSKDFFYLIVHLVSIEIRLNLEDNKKKLQDILGNVGQLNELIIYLNLFEKFVIFMSTSDDVCEDGEQIQHAIGLFIETVKTILGFLNDCVDEFDSIGNSVFLIALIRAIGCWFAYEDLVENEIIEFFEKLVKFLQSCDFDDKANRLGMSIYKFLMPGLKRFLDTNQVNEGDAVDEELSERLDTVKNLLKTCEDSIQKLTV